jgi:hypothetical protein
VDLPRLHAYANEHITWCDPEGYNENGRKMPFRARAISNLSDPQVGYGKPNKEVFLQLITPSSPSDVNLFDGQEHYLWDVGGDCRSSGLIGRSLAVVALGVHLDLFEVVHPLDANDLSARNMISQVLEHQKDVRFRAC